MGFFPGLNFRSNSLAENINCPPLSSMTDARDAEQLSKNKVTHILSVHDSARPMLEVRAQSRACVCPVSLGLAGAGDAACPLPGVAGGRLLFLIVLLLPA